MISLAGSLRRFFIFFFSLLGILTIILVLLEFERITRINRLESGKREITTIQNSLETYFNLRIELLKNHATFPLIIQTVMQPQYFSENVRDFMKNLSFFGNKYELILISHQGNIITTTGKLSKSTFNISENSDRLLDGSIRVLRKTSIEETGNFWVIGVPVVYNGQCVGALYAKIPITELQKNPIMNEQTKGYQITIYKNTTPLFSSGSASENSKIFNVWTSIPGVSISLSVDTGNSTKIRLQTISILLLPFITLWGIAIITSSYLSQWLITIPLKKLEFYMKSISDGIELKKIPEDNRISEISEFILNFQILAEKVQERESSLLNTRNELKEKNRQLILNQEKLVHADKMASLGQLAAGVAHEINNPIGFVLSNTGTLDNYIGDIKSVLDLYSKNSSFDIIEKRKDEIDFKETLEDIDQLLEDNRIGLKRISAIVQNLKRFSHTDDSEKITMENINMLMDETLMIAQNEIKYVTKTESSYRELPPVAMRRGEISQVLLNIIINAAQALKSVRRPSEKNLIKIKTFLLRNVPAISIFDNGSGMDSLSVSKIFDPFYTTKPVGEGTGLGLSISYDIIVRSHGGTINVYSRPEIGTCFIITFPKGAENDA